jgi:hypothetical protein
MSLKFKFDLNSNWFGIYKIDFKKIKGFLFFLAYWAKIGSAKPASSSRMRPAQPSRPVSWPTGPRARTRVAPVTRPDSAESDTIGG